MTESCAARFDATEPNDSSCARCSRGYSQEAPSARPCNGNGPEMGLIFTPGILILKPSVFRLI